MSNSDVFEALAPLLVDAIINEVSSHEIPKPICSVRVYYFDTHADSTYLTLRTMSEKHRAKLVAEHGSDAPYYLWASSEEERDGDIDLPGDDASTDTHAEITRLFQGVYDLLCDDDNDDDAQIEFQQMLQRVCRELNAKDWSVFCEVTDDFVIAPADGSQYFGGDEDYNDLINSIPADRLALLRSRKLLGPGEDDWDSISSDE